ncbi:MobQ family relaxase [Sphingomonas sp. TREG-RG-20F-R18-01]|uniref:MobQ family relaxase n=1 Tax=Sphingomonas sp. TREG-RG-20F-R18-01 TaxID=2914982 RepID=UPI001F59AD3C|nr:MobQ family relaxase [Sphingomonas sp. TREG-RG-20F-R18-01]
MASFHLAVKTVGRSAGRSATAAAAYRAGVEIEDERSGIVHDYTRKQGIEHREIVAPTDAPAWVQDRSALWNAAEKAETRKNSTVAREYEIALPAELSADERRDLAVGLAREISERHGVAVDVAIHAPGRQGDQRNHHAHLLTTTRRIGAEGLGEKTRELDQKTSGEVERWRERYAEMQNAALERAHSPERVDHRSNQRRGIEQEATVHMGPGVAAMERRAERTAQREGREHTPATRVGQHNAGVLEKRGLRQYIEQGTEFVREMTQRATGHLRSFAATLSGAVDRDRREATEAQQREQLAAERARLVAQERQQAHQREQVAERFRTIAARREAGAHGYTDQSSDWRATPEALRRAVDAYNRANQHTKDLYIERIQREPQMAQAMAQLVNQRERTLQRDQGLSR